ncbi:MAG TPA: hypothetical protein DCZ95_19885 [Verrucomicrobia bacterium]|nr:MAG: hypothetical protein A2X46_17785 [Lentisphaerae bacterium GWF2_57_35]HBA86347.1 hypothetical protein [Verrucomicrobiota bacterium]
MQNSGKHLEDTFLGSVGVPSGLVVGIIVTTERALHGHAQGEWVSLIMPYIPAYVLTVILLATWCVWRIRTKTAR